MAANDREAPTGRDSPPSSGTPEDLPHVVGAMKVELDALQAHVMRDAEPAYIRHAPAILSAIVAVAALGFSYWTNEAATDRLERQDQHAAKAELRSLLQRLHELPKENFEIGRTYSADPGARAFYGSTIQAESILLAQQAAALIEQLEGAVGADEYSQTAYALTISGLTAQADELVAKGLEVADNAVSEAALLRQAAQSRFARADVAGGREIWQRALNVFEKYPESDRIAIASSLSYTETLWATAELTRDCAEARRHIIAAQEHASALVGVAYVDNARANIDKQCPPEPVS